MDDHDAMRYAPKPCIERLSDGRGCPNFAVVGVNGKGGNGRCEQHGGKPYKGGTHAWKKARAAALNEAGNRCERCGKTQAQARAEGKPLQVHHLERGASIASGRHDRLRALCRVCHDKVHGKRRR
jgi:hypothetical protein